MITSQQREFLSEIIEGQPIPEDKLVYFRERLRDRLHSAIVSAYVTRSKENGLKQKDLAVRIHRTSAQITRWFSTASNLTLDSISDLMVGLGMDFDAFPFTPIERMIAPQETHANDVHFVEWVEDDKINTKAFTVDWAGLLDSVSQYQLVMNPTVTYEIPGNVGVGYVGVAYPVGEPLIDPARAVEDTQRQAATRPSNVIDFVERLSDKRRQGQSQNSVLAKVGTN
jgi:transcriptional regulator with XRE-family HTH domain